MRRLCVVDTNVVVSGLVSRGRDAPPQLILDAMLAAELGFALSVELLAEYRDVLLRPGITALHGLGDAEVDEILKRLALEAIETAPDPVPVPDGVEPGDEHVARLVLTLPAGVLITGDHALAVAMAGACEVLTAAQAAAMLSAPAS